MAKNSPVTIPGWTFDARRDPSFRYEDGPHFYWLKGQRIWSATGVLKAVGYIDDRYYTHSSAQRGKMVHLGTHHVDDNDLHSPDWPDGMLGYFEAYQEMKLKWKFTPRLREVPLYHPDFIYGVTPDGEGEILGGEPAIIELKSGAMPWWARYQTALQEIAIRSWEEKPVWRRRVGIELRPNGSFKPFEFNDPADYVKSQAIVIAAQNNEARPLVRLDAELALI